MKITITKLREIIKEALDPIRVKPIQQKDFDPPTWSDATEPRIQEKPIKKVGSFFMTNSGDDLPKRGYAHVKKLKKFYMMLPDGEGIRIGPFPGEPKITRSADGQRYLNALHANVEVLPISNVRNPTDEDILNWRTMQGQIMSTAKGLNK